MINDPTKVATEVKKENIKATIYKVEDCLDTMLDDLENGKKKGTTTYNNFIDQAWTWRQQEFNIWTGYANEGKALDIETEIPTPNGFTFMRDLRVGDVVFDEQGKPCNIINVTDIMYGHTCYKITFSDGTHVIADANHQWVVDDEQTRASKQRQTKRTQTKKRGTDQRSKILTSQTLTTEEMISKLVVKNKYNYSIPLCKPIQYDKKELVLHPYLLGAWLGDGSKDHGQITTADIKILERFSEQGFTITKHQSKYSYGVLKLKVLLRKLGVLKNKHIPWEYLFSCYEDRLALLQGLMDTDGFTDNLGRCEFTSVDLHLTTHVHRLMTSLGIKVYYTEDVAKLNGKIISPRYRLRFKTELPVFCLKRKRDRQLNARKPKNNCRQIVAITPVESVPVKCIEVDSFSHMYLCTEHYIPTHNSLFIKQLILAKALKEKKKFAFCSPEDYPPAEFYDDMIHTLTGLTTDRDRKNRVKTELYKDVAHLINELFYFVYVEPPNNTIKGVLERFKQLHEVEGLYGCVIDPLLKFSRPKNFSERDDIYAAYIGSICVDFARQTDTSLHLVMHQLTPRIDDNKKYPEPSMYTMKGGGSWADGADNVLSVWRPHYAQNKEDTEVQFASQKIKKQKLVGIPQRLKTRFDRVSNRYVDFETGVPLFNFDKWIYE
jgi:hypothetical protein